MHSLYEAHLRVTASKVLASEYPLEICRLYLVVGSVSLYPLSIILVSEHTVYILYTVYTILYNDFTDAFIHAVFMKKNIVYISIIYLYNPEISVVRLMLTRTNSLSSICLHALSVVEAEFTYTIPGMTLWFQIHPPEG